MSDLADLLERLHGAGARWATVRATVRQWGDGEVSGVAMRRHAERRAARRQSSGTVMGFRRGDGPAQWETVTRAWVDRVGDRQRTESSGAHGDRLTVRVGSLWWSYTPKSGSISNESEPEVGGGGGGEIDWMLEPSGLIPALDFTVTGSEEVAGRPVLTAVAVPRPEDPRRGFGAHFAHGADDVVLAVDHERGVVLRSESRVDGRTFAIVEVTEVVFDEDFADDLFVFASPDGSPVRSPRGAFPRPEPVSIEEAAAKASFTVLVPSRLPLGWTTEVRYAPRSERPPRPDSVTIHILSGERREVRLRVQQSGEPMREALQWEEVDHGGRRILLFRHEGPGATFDAKAEIEGTHVRVSGQIERASLLDIVANLRPAPRSLPPMTDR